MKLTRHSTFEEIAAVVRSLAPSAWVDDSGEGLVLYDASDETWGLVESIRDRDPFMLVAGGRSLADALSSM
jgi:hypothetical protein